MVRHMSDNKDNKGVKLRLYEAGQGFPDVGDLVFDSRDGMLYQIVSESTNITTHGHGVGNSIDVRAVDCSDQMPLDDGDWDAMVHVRIEPMAPEGADE